MDPRAAQQIRSLLAAKEAAIEAEDYDAAKRLKTAEMQLRALGGQLAQLEVAKRRAVRDEDYDRAKLLKDEILALRRRVSEALQECAIVAITQSRFEEQQPSPPSPPMLEDSMTIKSFAANDVLSKSSKPSSTPSSLEMTAPSQLRELPHTTVLPPSMLDEDENDQLGSLEDILAPVSSSITGELQLLTHSPEPLSKTPQVTDERGALDGAFDHSQSDAVSSLRSEDVLQNAHLAGSDFGSAMKVEPHALNALSSVPNAAELPVPEPFASDMGGDTDIAAVIALLGDYRARCLFSKNWALREAALAKTRILLHKDNWERFEDLEQLCDVAQLGVHDKIAQVYLTALALLDDVAHKFAARGFKRTEAFPALEPALAAVVTKLGDNQPRLRDKAVDALTSLSRCRVVGADRVAEKVMRSLDKRRPPHNKWRPIATRLEFLKCLACEFGVENRDASRKGSHALVLESVIAFVETHGCASHTFEEVRTAAKDLVVDVFATVSDADRERLLDPFLNKLRPKQAEEYRIAVDRGLSRHINNLNNDRSNSILRTLKAAPAPKAAPQQFSSPMLEAIPSTTTASSYCPSHIRDIPTYDGDNE